MDTDKQATDTPESLERKLEHLRDEWGTAGLVAKALAPVPLEQVRQVFDIAVGNTLRDSLLGTPPVEDNPSCPEHLRG